MMVGKASVVNAMYYIIVEPSAAAAMAAVVMSYTEGDSH